MTIGTLLGLAWPIVLARATQSAVGFADARMVAPLGEAELAATSTGALNTFVLIILPMGTAFIVQSFTAQLVGKGRAGETHRFAWYGLAVAAAAMALALIALPFMPYLLGFVDVEPAVRGKMTEYVQIRLLSVGAAVGFEAIGNWYAGLGNTRMQLYAGVLTMVVNVLLNWVFIYGHLGAPALGTAGAALASALSTWIGFLALLAAFRLRLGAVPRVPGPLGLKKAELWRVIRFGLPSGINWFLEFGAFMLFINVVVVDLGTPTLAAMNVVLAVNMLSFMPAFGIASAGAILAGQAIGRGEPDLVPRIVTLTMRTAAIWMGGIGAVYLIAPAAIVAQFRPDGVPAEALFSTGVVMLQMSAAWQVFDAIALTLSEVLRSAGDTTWPMLARMGLAWAVFVPGSIVVVTIMGGGEVAAMLCLIAYLALLAATLAYRFLGGAWRRIELTEAEPTIE